MGSQKKVTKKKKSKAKPQKKQRKAKDKFLVTLAEGIEIDYARSPQAHVPYQPSGHYHAHYGAESDDICCSQPKPTTDNVKFIEINTAFCHPYVYESFDRGRLITVSTENKIVEFQDTGNGIEWLDSFNNKMGYIDYGILDYLLNAIRIMDGVQNNQILGNESYWVGINNQVGNFNELLQNLNQMRNNKKEG